MDGFFFIDKPTGMTSFDVLRDMRRILGIKKIGHTGTLDPLATGGLLVATGNYTKLLSYINTETKQYQATIMLNGTSDSYDSDTNIDYITQNKQDYYSKNISKTDIQNILKNNFSGTIKQIPPAYSALKINGKKALERVKAGENIVMKARETEIYKIEIRDFEYPKLEIKLDVKSGTYVRSIAHDLGQILGTGGYISELRRTKIGNLDTCNATELHSLTPNSQLALENIFPNRISFFQDEDIYKRLADGQRVRGDFNFIENKDIFLIDREKIRYVVEYKDGVIHPRKKIIDKI